METDLVGVDADERGLHDVDDTVEILGGARLGVGKVAVHNRRGPLPEGETLPDHALPQQALRFVRCHAKCLRDWEVRVFGWPSLLVHGVSALVDGARHSLDPVAFAVPVCRVGGRGFRA
jgi:hypothetical protein